MTHDRFDVKRAGKETVIVDHPLGSPRFYEVKNPDKFWSQSKDEQRKQVIDFYADSIDVENSELMAAMEIINDAAEFQPNSDYPNTRK